MTEPGTRTEDLNAIHGGPPGPAHDDRLRRFGRRNYTAGTALAVTNIIAAFLTSMLAENQAFTDPDGILIATLTHIAIMVLAGALVVVGALQTITAHTRAAIGDMRGDIDRNRRRLDQQAGEIHDLEMTVRSTLNAIMPLSGLLKSIPERMDGLETATAVIAEHLPDALKSENWRGFNAAVREGFTGQQTGTDGQAKRRPPHIGLVPPRGEAGDKP